MQDDTQSESNLDSVKELLTTDQAATLLNIKKSTLVKWRCTGVNSLVFVRINRLIRYDRKDLQDFIKKQKIRGKV